MIIQIMKNECSIFTDNRSFFGRLFRRWFPLYTLPIPDDLNEYAPSYIDIESRSRFGWSDRLRVLISGKICYKILMKTDAVVTKSEMIGLVFVLSPTDSIRPNDEFQLQQPLTFTFGATK